MKQATLVVLGVLGVAFSFPQVTYAAEIHYSATLEGTNFSGSPLPTAYTYDYRVRKGTYPTDDGGGNGCNNVGNNAAYNEWNFTDLETCVNGFQADSNWWSTATQSTTGNVYYVLLYRTSAGIWSIVDPVPIPGLIWDSGNPPDTEIFIGSTTVNINQAFNSGGLSTTTMQNFCDVNMPYDNSSIINATLTAIPNGLCRVGVFLTVPTAESMNQFNTLASSTKSKFPFSYITSVTNTWETLAASTTPMLPTCPMT